VEDTSFIMQGLSTLSHPSFTRTELAEIRNGLGHHLEDIQLS
jgi:hypothetical protein